MAKPTGTNGPFRVQVNPDGSVSGSFMSITLPKIKAEVEQHIVDRFLASMNMHLASTGEQFFLSAPQLNQENDFDFTVASPRGDAFLELMEVAPLNGPYENAPASYNVYDFARSIFQGILSKSDSYPKKMAKDLFLLIYATHWSFTLSRSVIACLQYWCARRPLAFQAIFSYQPLDEQSGAPYFIYPVPPDLLKGFDPKQVRDKIVQNLDPRNWNIVSGSDT